MKESKFKVFMLLLPIILMILTYTASFFSPYLFIGLFITFSVSLVVSSVMLFLDEETKERLKKEINYE